MWFWPVPRKEHVRIIGQYRKTRSRPRNFGFVNRFWNFKPQNFAPVATVTWIVGSSIFWYQYDRSYIVFRRMDSAKESKMNDFWRNFVERHQMTVLIRFLQYTITVYQTSVDSAWEIGSKTEIRRQMNLSKTLSLTS